MLSNTLRAGSILAASLIAMPTALPQTAVPQSIPAQSVDTPQTRLRPIGSPSIVDQFRSTNRGGVQQTAAGNDGDSPAIGSGVQQTVFMQNGVAPVLPNGGGIPFPDNFSPPPISTAPFSAPPVTLPPATAPRALPTSPVPVQPAPSAGTFVPGSVNTIPNQDYAPLAQPRLANQFATMDNSCHVSGPSTYTAASASGCAQVGYQAPPAYLAPPAPVAAPPVAAGPIMPAPVVVPGAPIIASPTGAPVGSLISFGQEKYQVQVGQGLFGQPVAYVPGQKFRNWIRYVFP
jgi:hypothetical protein